MSGWGSTPWGSGPWGSGGTGAFALLTAQAYRENIIRLVFNEPVYFTQILDPADASGLIHYQINTVPGTTGYDALPVRPVRIVSVESDRIESPNIIDLVLDRPMTPYPAEYTVTITNLFSADLTTAIASFTSTVIAVYRTLQKPSVDTTVPSRDFANPQTLSASQQSGADVGELNLGSITVDATGDYAFDEGMVNLKKRILRRLITIPGGFAHLPTYGVGIPSFGKKLGTPAVQAQLAAQAQKQLALEPEIETVQVHTKVDPNVPGLVRFQIVAKIKGGPKPRTFDVPFLATDF